MREETKWTLVLCLILVIGFGAIFAIVNSEPAECAEVDISPTTFSEQVNDTQLVVQEAQAEQIAAKEAEEAAQLTESVEESEQTMDEILN